MEAKAPPGMEDVVKRLKKNPKVKNPFAIAWNIYRKRGKAATDISDEDLDSESETFISEYSASLSRVAMLPVMKYSSIENHELSIELEGMSLQLPVLSEEHPNRVPFSGVLTRIDEESTRSPNGSAGHRVLITKAVAEAALNSLIGMGVDVSEDFTEHNTRMKIGVITGAEIQGKDLIISGHLYGSDFPKEVAKIKANKNILGMSYECKRVFIRNTNSDIWVPESLIFTGAAILLRDSAAYQDTSIVASKDLNAGSVPGNVSTKKLDPDDPWDAPALKDFTEKSWEELSESEKSHIAGHFAWSSELPPKSFGSLKLPHHDPKTGSVNKHGVDNAMARLNQTSVPSEDKSKIQSHLEAHQKQFGEDEKEDIQSSKEKDMGDLLEKLDALREDLKKIISKGEVILHADDKKEDKIEEKIEDKKEEIESTYDDKMYDDKMMKKNSKNSKFLKVARAMMSFLDEDEEEYQDDMKDKGKMDMEHEDEEMDRELFRKMLRRASASAEASDERMDKVEKAVEAMAGLLTDVTHTMKGLLTDYAEKKDGLHTDDAKVNAANKEKPEDAHAERKTLTASDANKFLAKYNVEPDKEYTVPELDKVLKAAGVDDPQTRLAVKLQLQDRKLLK